MRAFSVTTAFPHLDDPVRDRGCLFKPRPRYVEVPRPPLGAVVLA